MITLGFLRHRVQIRKKLAQNIDFQPQNTARNLVLATQLSGVAVNTLIPQTTVTSTY